MVQNKIVAIEIVSAEVMRERSDIRAAEIEKENELQRLIREAQEREAERELFKKLPLIIQSIMQDIAEAAENGSHDLYSQNWYLSTEHWGMDYQDVEKLAPVIAEILGQAGYKVYDVHWYSSSWRYRSGKILSWGRISW